LQEIPRDEGESFPEFFPTIFRWHGVLIPERLLLYSLFNDSMKNNRPTSRFHRCSGFTLLEMVIVLGIIAMILGGAIYSMNKIGDSAKLSQVDSDFKSYKSSLAMYKLNAGSYPTTQQGLKALVEKPSSTPVPRRWSAVMDKLSNDPWGRPYGYRFPAKKDPNDCEMFSLGADGQEGTADDQSSKD
jgi:general secretion pathway protein G